MTTSAPNTASRVFVIAEAGVNHNGDLALAEKLVDAAKDAGADAVKFQTFRAAEIISSGAPLAPYQRAAGITDTQFKMIEKLELTEAMHRSILDRCIKANIEFMSTPFDAESADLLDALGMKRFKIPSGELTNRRLLEHVARKRKPVILSTGMSDLAEVKTAVDWILQTAAVSLTILHCVTEYPAPADQINLRAIDTLRNALQLPVGYSDHTPGIEISIAAAALGASVIEKHITLDRTLPGPDQKASIEPAEFKEMVRCIRNVTASLGDGIKRMAPCEEKNRPIARRSLVAARDLPAGHVLREEDLRIKRPGTGLPPAAIDQAIGKKLKRRVEQDEVLTADLI